MRLSRIVFDTLNPMPDGGRFCTETGPFGSDAMKNDEVAIEQLLDQMADAWNRGDAKS